jgi:ribosomal protein S18 acetylase RimI-like enzyme
MVETGNEYIEDVREIETMAANAWRPEIEQHLDGWRLRVSGGSSSRVNSVWPNRLIGSLSLEARLGIVEDFYRRHQMPACFQLCPAALPDGLYEELQQRGYFDEKATSVKIASIDTVLERSEPPRFAVIQSPTLTEEWFQAYTTASGYDKASLPIRHGILSRIGPEANFLLVEVDGVTAATGLGVAERGWMGIFCVVTFEQFRRQGLACQVMHGLSAWGKTGGVQQLYLQVMENNPPALRLYDKLGFSKRYEYWYSTKALE